MKHCVKSFIFCNLPTETHDLTQPTKWRKISTQPNLQADLTLVSPKTEDTKLMLWQILTDFQNSCTCSR